MKYAQALIAALVSSLVLSGCGGGGGGGGSPPVVSPPSPPSPPPPVSPPPPPGTTPSTSSAEYLRNWGVAGVKANTAWQAGATGVGVEIAVIDSGFDPTHPELAGQLLAASKDIDSTRNVLNDPHDQHGSEVASFIVGKFNGDKTVGVAYGAKVLAIRADDGADGFAYSSLIASVNYAVAQGVDIINLSLGGSSPPPVGFANALQAATAAGIIVVVSAGNDGASASEVNYPAFYATNPSISHNLIIAAGGSNSNGTFNAVSNPAGTAKDFYIVAPGWQVYVPDFGDPGPVPGFQVCFSDNTCEIQGTSYSSPHTAAALALLKQAFPGLTPAQLVQLILISADDMGAVGVDTTTGHGRLNLTTAFSSVGLVHAPLPGGFGELAAGAPLGAVGAAFGDAFANPEAWKVTGFDSFGRSFEMTLANSWRGEGRASLAEADAPVLWRSSKTPFGTMYFAAAPEVSMPQTMRMRDETSEHAAFRNVSALSDHVSVAFSSGTAVSPGDNPAPLSGFMALSGEDKGVALSAKLGGGFGFTLMNERGGQAGGIELHEVAREASGARASFERGPLSLAMTYGALNEDGAGLGLSWMERWGNRPVAETHFAGIAAALQIAPGWEAGAQMESGRTRISGNGWLTPVSDLKTTSAAMALRWNAAPNIAAGIVPDAHGAVTLSVSQPLRVEEGAFNALLPTADEYGRYHLAFENRLIDASPSGREIETRLGYALWAADEFSAQLDLSYTQEPGHRAAAPGEVAMRMGLRKAF